MIVQFSAPLDNNAIADNLSDSAAAFLFAICIRKGWFPILTDEPSSHSDED